MKKFKVLLALSIFVLCAVSAFFLEKPKMVFAIESNAPSDYYEPVRGLKGEELKKGLHDIIKGHKIYKYGGTLNNYLKDIDTDPNNKNNVILVYTGSASKSTSFNKEHVWAKSHGDFSGKFGPDGDLNNLRPCYSNLNSTRSNYNFGNGGDEIRNYPGNKVDRSQGTFEPSDDFKGDVARIIFYMATRYEGIETYPDGTIYKWPDLEVVDYVNNSKSPEIGVLSDLLEWNLEDEVSTYEVSRNNKVYSDYQYNRNPFIDHPEFINMIYDKNYSGPGALDDKNGSGQGQVTKKTFQEVIEEINLIGKVTTNSGTLISKAERSYQALSNEEKLFVTNYDTLLAKRVIFDKLTKFSNFTEGSLVFNGNFNNKSCAASNSYSENVSVKLNNKSFLANCAFVNKSEFRLGANSSKVGCLALDQKYKISGYESGALLEMMFDVDSANKIEIKSSTTYGEIENLMILYSVDGGSTYKKYGEQAYSTSKTIEIVGESLKNVRFSLLIPTLSLSEPPRICLLEFNIYKAKEEQASKEVMIFNELMKNLEAIDANSNPYILAAELYYDSLSSEDKEKVDHDLLVDKRDSFNVLYGEDVDIDASQINEAIEALKNITINLETVNDVADKIYNLSILLAKFNISGGNIEEIVELDNYNSMLSDFFDFINQQKNILLEYLNDQTLITEENKKVLKVNTEKIINVIKKVDIIIGGAISTEQLEELLEILSDTSVKDFYKEIKDAILDLQDYIFSNGISFETKSLIEERINNIDANIKKHSLNIENISTYEYVTTIKSRLQSLKEEKEEISSGCNDKANVVMMISFNLTLAGLILLKKKSR